MIRTYKYRLRPTKKQGHLLDRLFDQMQTVYNDALHERRQAWQRSRRSVSFVQQWNRMRDERRRLPDEMGMLNATSIQQMLRRLDKAYQSLYKGRGGPPRFKNAQRFKSIEYRHGDGCKLTGDRLYIQHIGQPKIILHRELPPAATIRHLVVKRSLDKWHVCLMLESPDAEPARVERPAVGIDVGVHHLLALSAGTIGGNPRWLRSNLAALRMAQRRFSRRKKGGSHWRT